MRIFCAVRHSNDAQFYYGGLWSGNFYPALRRLGHEIIESRVDLLPASRFMHVPTQFTKEESLVREGITHKIVDEIRKAHTEKPLDLFLSYFYNAHFEPAGFDEVHRLGIPSVNFYCNSIYQFDWVAKIAARAAYSWHTEKEARSLYRNVGANPVWVQMAADPEVYHPVLNVVRQRKACFVGQRYCDRDRWLAALIHCGIPIDIYGDGWGLEQMTKNDCVASGESPPGSMMAYVSAVRDNLSRNGWVNGGLRTIHQGIYAIQTRRLRTLYRPHAKGRADSIPKVFGKYEMVLNFSNVWADGRAGSKLIPHVRLRDFEAPMCRTCYLTGHTHEIEEFYEIGREIDCYRSAEELVDKVRFYLEHPTAAELLREAGYQRARRDHTWERRFQQLFSEINLPSTV